MEIDFSQEAQQQLTQIKKTNPKLFNKIQQKLHIFIENPKHPFLRTHKLRGKLKNSWSISIEKTFRMVFTFQKGEVLFFIMGKHEEVYK